MKHRSYFAFSEFSRMLVVEIWKFGFKMSSQAVVRLMFVYVSHVLVL